MALSYSNRTSSSTCCVLGWTAIISEPVGGLSKSMMNTTFFSPFLASLDVYPYVCLSFLSVFLFLTALLGVLLEERVAVRIILLFEVCLSAIIGYVVSISLQVGVIAFVLVLVFLVVAAVESILLFGFIVLLHHLNQISDLSRSHCIQG
jgi:NADH:ubiquinone oxidoreductase subunit K